MNREDEPLDHWDYAYVHPLLRPLLFALAYIVLAFREITGRNRR